MSSAASASVAAAPGAADAQHTTIRLLGYDEVRLKCDARDKIADVRSFLPKEIPTFSAMHPIDDEALWNDFRTDRDAENRFLNRVPKPVPAGPDVLVAGKCFLAVPPQVPIGSGLFSIPENSTIVKMAADMADMKVLLARQKKQNPPKDMSKASTKAFQAAQRVNGFVVRSKLYPWRVPVTLRGRIPAAFPWRERSEPQANADLVTYLRRHVVEGVEALKKLHLFTIDATGVPFQYSFDDDSEEGGTGEHFTLTGKTDAIIVDKAAAGVPSGSPDPGLAMASSIMFVDFKTAEAMTRTVASPAASGGAGTGRKRHREDYDDDQDNEKPTGDLVMRQLILQMLTFHANYGRWIPVVATDFATAIRIWEQDGTAIWEYGSNGDDGAIGALSLEEGIAIMRHLLDKGAKLMPGYDAKLSEPEEEDLSGNNAPGDDIDDDDRGGGGSGGGGGASGDSSKSSGGGVGGGRAKGGSSEAQVPLELRRADDEQAGLRLRYNIQRVLYLNPLELLEVQ